MLSALRSEKADRLIRPAIMVVMALFFALFFVTLCWYSLKSKVIYAMLAAAIFFFLLALLRGQLKQRPVYVLGFVFVLWFIATRLILGDTKLAQSYYLAAEIIIIYVFVFPFAAMLTEKQRAYFLDGLALVFVGLNLIGGTVGLWAFLSGETIYFPGNLSSGMFEGRLHFLELNENVCGLFMAISIVFTVYLLLRARHRGFIIPGVFLILFFYCILVLTDCRLVKIALPIILLPITAVATDALWSRQDKQKEKILVMVLAMLASFVLCYLGYNAVSKAFVYISLHRENEISESLTETETAVSEEEKTEELAEEPEHDTEEILAKRELLDGDYSGRLSIYVCFIRYLRDHPSVFLTGAPNFYIRTMTSYGSGDPQYNMCLHLHNSFFQTLALTGIPGLLLILAICVYLLVYSLRVLFGDNFSPSQKIIPIFLLLLIIEAVGETMIFVPFDIMANVVPNALFFLCAGYTVELGRGKKRTQRTVKKPSISP